MKIGVIGHTQHLDNINKLTPRAEKALWSVDLVIHVGNIGDLAVLRAFQKFGLTFAVYGQQDSEEVKRFVDEEKVVEFANRRIGMIFKVDGLETNRTLSVLKRPSITPESLAQQLLNKFKDVDCVLFGYPGQAFSHLHKGILVFNPGQLVDPRGEGGTMGILELTERVITGRILRV